MLKLLHKWKNIGHNKHKEQCCRVNYTLRCYDDYDELIFEGKGCKVNSKNNGKDCGWKIIVNSMTNSQNIDVKDFSLSNFMPINELFEDFNILNFKYFIFAAMRNAREIYYKQDGFYEQINKSEL